MKTFLFVGFIQAKASKEPSEESKKFNLSACAIFKDESRYLKEWIEYHRLVGVDHFYLYDNGSQDTFSKVLAPYIDEGVVTLVSWPDYLRDQREENAFIWALSTQVSAYENAVKIKASQETKWLVFIDLDEFLVSPTKNQLIEILEQYEDYPAVLLDSDFYDSSRMDTLLPRRELVIETIEFSSPPLPSPQKAVSKMIFKPEQCEGFTLFPYTCCFKDNQAAIKLKKRQLRINRYTNRKVDYWHLPKAKEKLHVDHRMLSEEELGRFLEAGYEIEDTERAIYRFLPQLRKKMGHEDKWPNQ